MSLVHQIALSLVPQVGAVTAKLLAAHFGGAEAVFQAKRAELLKIPSIGATVADSLAASASVALERAEREAEFVEKHRIEPLFFTDDRYPARLRQCHDSPALLFFKGSSADLLGARRVVGIVGTRQPSDQGKAMCEELVEGLTAYNVLMVSGMAFGIDITAHRRASALDIPNIGVLGNGLASIYPSQHRSTALQMIENGGLLTEYTSGQKPDRENFPMRNRIIAGLCDVLLVVETAQSGGSMITADLAFQYDRQVVAVPGRPRDVKSAGCNLLIKNEKARLVESAKDLADIMAWPEVGKQQAVQMQIPLDLSAAERGVLDIVRQRPEIPVDQLALASQLSPGELASVILGLEFKGLVRTLPGKRYVVTG
jgi:DNA processing protein